MGEKETSCIEVTQISTATNDWHASIKIQKNKINVIGFSVWNSCLQDSNSFRSLFHINSMKNVLKYVASQYQMIFYFSGPESKLYCKIVPAKLANHSKTLVYNLRDIIKEIIFPCPKKQSFKISNIKLSTANNQYTHHPTNVTSFGNNFQGPKLGIA